TGPIKHDPDEFLNAPTTAAKVNAILDALHSRLGLVISCSGVDYGGGAVGGTIQGVYTLTSTESLLFNRDFLTMAESGGSGSSRDVSDIIFHEISHQHGFYHEQTTSVGCPAWDPPNQNYNNFNIPARIQLCFNNIGYYSA